jgi:hypothetical protein
MPSRILPDCVVNGGEQVNVSCDVNWTAEIGES